MKLSKICVTSSAESALKKLKKASVPVYDCEKRGAEFIFRVKDKDIKKVFAIFHKPCYNIRTEGMSAKGRLLSAVALRAGLIFGAAFFTACAIIANLLVLRIDFEGNAGYLEGEIRSILSEEGAAFAKPYSALNRPLATGRILALPDVTFCNISKRGSVVIVDVRVDGQNSAQVNREPLVSDCDGKVEKIVAVCGTPAKSAGDSVKRGEILIFAHNIVEEKEYACIAVGYADILVEGKISLPFPEDNEKNRKSALVSIKGEGELKKAEISVLPSDGGIIYEITYIYARRLSINLT